MAKRKLNKQQQRRIKAKHQRSSVPEEITGEESGVDNSGLGPEQAGVVTSHFGTQVEIEAADRSTRRCHIRANLETLVTGDEVIWRDGDPTGVVVALKTRRSVLKRPDPYGEMKAIASNIDVIVIVVAPLPELHANLIDRYLVAAESSGITPVLVLNKIDLINDDNRSRIDSLMAIYRGIGYATLQTSTYSKQGLTELARMLKDRTSVLVGQSGVGKSSLINELVPELELKTGALSESTEKGTHTTTQSRLLHLPGTGRVIDSPGIREFGLWHMEREAILEGFIEFRHYLGHCKFRDCRHEQEPGCALLEALAKGEISSQRFFSCQQIINDLNNDQSKLRNPH